MARTCITSLLVAALFTTGPLSPTGISADTYDKSDGTPISSHVRTAVGGTVQLSCHVPERGVTVEWVRQRQQAHQLHQTIISHPTSVGIIRTPYEVSCLRPTDYCILKIMNVRKEQSGIYQCNVDSHPPIRNSVDLSVVDPETTILGEPVREHLEASTINLTCVIEPNPGSDVTVAWLHDCEYVTDFAGGHYSILTTETDTSIASHLLINYAEPSDSGKYICEPSIGTRESVVVRVEQVVPDDDYLSASGSQQPLAVGLLALAVAATAFTSL